jgi:hypothetical protein
VQDQAKNLNCPGDELPLLPSGAYPDTIVTIHQEQQADNKKIGATVENNSAETSSIPYQARLKRSPMDEFSKA